MIATTTRYLTDAEALQAAMNRLRLQHGANATPDQHPGYWQACMIVADGAAAGDAFFLLAIRDDAKEITRRWSAQPVRTGRSYIRRIAGAGVRWS